jgi:hypothetical protein
LMRLPFWYQLAPCWYTLPVPYGRGSTAAPSSEMAKRSLEPENRKEVAQMSETLLILALLIVFVLVTKE